LDSSTAHGQTASVTDCAKVAIGSFTLLTRDTTSQIHCDRTQYLVIFIARRRFPLRHSSLCPPPLLLLMVVLLVSGGFVHSQTIAHNRRGRQNLGRSANF